MISFAITVILVVMFLILSFYDENKSQSKADDLIDNHESNRGKSILSATRLYYKQALKVTVDQLMLYLYALY